MKMSNQKRGIKYLKGFKDGLEEAVIQLKEHKDDPIEKIIEGFEYAIKFLEEKTK